MIDLNVIEKGADYTRMSQSFVIFKGMAGVIYDINDGRA